MLPIPSIETPAPSSTADENGESRQQKPKILPCRYCSKKFRRVEHVQRHERTHTKEKPFACNWDRCGKTFGRRDLLVRHEKLVHLNEGSTNKEAPRPRKPSSAGAPSGPAENQLVDTDMLGMPQRPPQPPPHYAPEPMQLSVGSSMPPDSRLSARAPACNLDLLSDAATHLASGGEVNMQPAMMQGLGQVPASMTPVKPYHDAVPSYADRVREQDQGVMPGGYPAQPPTSVFADYDLLLDPDFPHPAHYFPPVLDDQMPGFWRHGGPSKPPSAFPSRGPSMPPDLRDASEGGPRLQEDGSRAPNWRVSQADHNVIKSRLDEFSSVLPNDFVSPSRHTLNRFLEGYISGFHEHLPFLHLPTLSPTDISPELLLAILAVGAQYRFETNRGHALWWAAKFVALEQIRRRHSHEVHGLLPTPAAYSPHSTRPSPSAGFRNSFPSVHGERPMTQDTHRELYAPNTPQARLETIQALLLLFASGLWGVKVILHETLSLQSLLAQLLREEGLAGEPNQQTADWEAWVRFETATRTKLVAYCFFNLCSIAYNTPPLLLTSEVQLYLPNPSRLWKAESAALWQEARTQTEPHCMEIPLQHAFSKLINRPTQEPLFTPTSLGSYVLIHALIQHIFLLKQTSFGSPSSFEFPRGLKQDDVEDIERALHCWRLSFEQHSQPRFESGHQAPGGEGLADGPVAFNSTALFKLAYIRLHTDLSPSRGLETRDPIMIALAFNNAPLLSRSPRLCQAVTQATFALSMLVKMGVNYVARTKSLEWSMQHSLCNLECAVLLSKWLLTLAAIGPAEQPLTPEEKQLLAMIQTMLNETEFAVPIDPSLAGSSAMHAYHPSQPADFGITDSVKLRRLACAVIKLWAETFKGAHMFDIVRIMAAGLERYAELVVEKPRDRTPVRRLVAGQGLG